MISSLQLIRRDLDGKEMFAPFSLAGKKWCFVFYLVPVVMHFMSVIIIVVVAVVLLLVLLLVLVLLHGVG